MAEQIVDFKTIIEALLDNSKPFSPVFLNRFSDLNPHDLAILEKNWPLVNPERRLGLMEDLSEMAEMDMLLSFDAVSLLAMSDSDPRVRSIAVSMYQDSENVSILPRLIALAEKDPDSSVRANAVTALGHFIYLGELDEISTEALQSALETVRAIYTADAPELVRRRALEALGFSSLPEVPELIQKAYDTGKRDWMISALFAMGRSADERWHELVLENLDSDDEEIQFEAVRAAGELAIPSARETLIEMVEAGIENDEIRAAAAWSLSQIGGLEVEKVLVEMQENAADDEEASFLEEALENLSFTNDLARLDMLSVDEVDEDELDSFIDIDQEDHEQEE